MKFIQSMRGVLFIKIVTLVIISCGKFLFTLLRAKTTRTIVLMRVFYLKKHSRVCICMNNCAI